MFMIIQKLRKWRQLLTLFCMFQEDIKKLPDGHSDMDLAKKFMKYLDEYINNIVNNLE